MNITNEVAGGDDADGVGLNIQLVNDSPQSVFFSIDQLTPAIGSPNPDTDGDGILNADDADHPDNASELDTDGDGIIDSSDPDIDGDGVLNADDADHPEDPNTVVGTGDGTSYSLTASSLQVFEGTSVTFSLATTGVAQGTSLGYYLANAADEWGESSGYPTGSFIIGADGTASVTFTPLEDQIEEGAEQCAFVLVGAGAVSADNGMLFITVHINDAATTPSEYTAAEVSLTGHQDSPVIVSMEIVNTTDGFGGTVNGVQFKILDTRDFSNLGDPFPVLQIEASTTHNGSYQPHGNADSVGSVGGDGNTYAKWTKEGSLYTYTTEVQALHFSGSTYYRVYVLDSNFNSVGQVSTVTSQLNQTVIDVDALGNIWEADLSEYVVTGGFDDGVWDGSTRTLAGSPTSSPVTIGGVEYLRGLYQTIDGLAPHLAFYIKPTYENSELQVFTDPGTTWSGPNQKMIPAGTWSAAGFDITIPGLIIEKTENYSITMTHAVTPQVPLEAIQLGSLGSAGNFTTLSTGLDYWIFNPFNSALTFTWTEAPGAVGYEIDANDYEYSSSEAANYHTGVVLSSTTYQTTDANWSWPKTGAGQTAVLKIYAVDADGNRSAFIRVYTALVM